MITIANNNEIVELSISEARDAYRVAVLEGYTGSRADWVGLVTGAIHESLLSGKGSIIVASESGNSSSLGTGDAQSGYSLIVDPSQPLGLRWAESSSVSATGVTSVFGRDGTVVGQTGDYSDTGITNTSSVNGGTVKDALDTLDSRINNTGDLFINSSGHILEQTLVLSDSGNLLNTDDSGNFLDNQDSGNIDYRITGLEYRLEQTGSNNVNAVTSVFGRQGVVISESGDYSDTGITNTSNILGDSVKGALNTIDIRLKDSGSLIIPLSGELESLNSTTSGDLNNSITGLEARVESTGQAAVLKSQYDAHTILAAQSNDNPQPVTIGNYEIIGKQLGDGIVSIGKPTSTEILNRSEQELRAYSPEDIGSFLTHTETGLQKEISDTGLLFVNGSGHILEQSLVLSDSGNFVDLQDSGALKSYLLTYIELTSGDIENSIENTGSSLYNLNNSTSGEINFRITGLEARLEDTGSNNINTVNSVFGREGVVISESGDYSDTGITNTSNVNGDSVKDALNNLNTKIDDTGGLLINGSGHILEQSLLLSDSGNLLDKQDSGNIDFRITGLENRLEQTGSNNVNLVDSVFGRQGTIVGQTGDYQDTGITNTSTVEGGTVKDAFDTIDTRLKDSGALGGEGLNEYYLQAALSPNGEAISAGTFKGFIPIPKSGTISEMLIDCDPNNEPSASSIEVDCNIVNRSNGTATSILSTVASIITGQNTGAGVINGTQTVEKGDLLSFDIDQGSDGKDLITTIKIT